LGKNADQEKGGALKEGKGTLEDLKWEKHSKEINVS